VDYRIKNIVITSFEEENSEKNSEEPAEEFLYILGSQCDGEGTFFFAPAFFLQLPPSSLLLLHFSSALHLILNFLPFPGTSAQQFKIKVKKIDAYFTGTGDLFSSLLIAFSITASREQKRENPENPGLPKLSEVTLKAVSVLQAILTSPHNSTTHKKENQKFQELNLVPCGDLIRVSPSAESLGLVMDTWVTEFD
jgi:pyridoxal/pyridoxine/pyridoxamine kinase